MPLLRLLAVLVLGRRWLLSGVPAAVCGDEKNCSSEMDRGCGWRPPRLGMVDACHMSTLLGVAKCEIEMLLMFDCEGYEGVDDVANALAAPSGGKNGFSSESDARLRC